MIGDNRPTVLVGAHSLVQLARGEPAETDVAWLLDAADFPREAILAANLLPEEPSPMPRFEERVAQVREIFHNPEFVRAVVVITNELFIAWRTSENCEARELAYQRLTALDWLQQRLVRVLEEGQVRQTFQHRREVLS